MLGPLPTGYKAVVFVCAVLSFFGLGVWLTAQWPDAALATAGSGLGAGLGVVAAVLLLHDRGDLRRH